MSCKHNWSAETHGGLLSRICHQCNLYELEVQVAELRELLDRTIADAWRAEIAKVAEERDALRAEVERLRGTGCREAKEGEPESGPCGVCLRCAEERGARWAIVAVRRGDVDAYRNVSKAAETVCVEARKGGGA